jgi:hypothetical protein
MYKRQLRLSGQNQIRTHLTQLVGKKINIVLNDNTVFFGELVRVLPSALDMLNMRLNKIEIPINTVYEIYLDTDA